MPKHLTDAQIMRYHADGLVFPIDVFTPEAAAGLRRRMEAVEAEHGALKYAMKPYLTLTLADEIAHDATVLDAVEDIIGPDILLWDGAFIIKEPHDDRYVSWHQDLTYWGIGPPEGVVSVWLALSPAGPENGCMRAIPCSHRGGILAHEDGFAENNLLSRGQTIAADIDARRAVDFVLDPGQMSLHHGRVIHGSDPSRSDERRIGVNFQYIAPSVRQTAIDNDMAMLVRGVDGFGHFAMEPRPEADFTPEGVALAADIGARRHKVLFRGTDATDAEKGRYGAVV